MKAIATSGPGVDIEDSESFVVPHTQDVAMATDKNRGPQGAYFGIDLLQVSPAIEAYVSHKDAGTLPLEALPLGVGEPHCVVVYVAIDSHHPLAKGGHLSGTLITANIPCTPNLIHLGEKVAKRLVEGAVKVRYDTYSYQFFV